MHEPAIDWNDSYSGEAAARDIEARLEVADATTWRPTGSFDLITSSFALPIEKSDRARFDRLAQYDMPTIDELVAGFSEFDVLRAGDCRYASARS